jgi:hypothetical protein
MPAMLQRKLELPLDFKIMTLIAAFVPAKHTLLSHISKAHQFPHSQFWRCADDRADQPFKITAK